MSARLFLVSVSLLFASHAFGVRQAFAQAGTGLTGPQFQLCVSDKLLSDAIISANATLLSQAIKRSEGFTRAKAIARQLRSTKLQLQQASQGPAKKFKQIKRRYRVLTALKKVARLCDLAPAPSENPPPVAVDINECSDGLDNDGDGLIDQEDDGGGVGAALGCMGPNLQESAIPRNGYTVFTPTSASRILYVSDSLGNDSFDGLEPYPVPGTNRGPKRTLTEGARLMSARRGNPDWLLLYRCDDFVNQYLGGFHSLPDGTRYGGDFAGDPSSGEKMLFGAYGNCPRRPRIMPRASSGMVLYLNDHDSDVAVTGIEFYEDRKDPYGGNFSPTVYSKGIVVTRGSRNILIEDNAFRFFAGNLQVESILEEGCPQVLSAPYDCPVGTVVENVAIRKNVIVDSYATGTHSQGIYSEGVRNLLIEENVFDHNGWSEYGPIADSAGATIYNHGMYLSKSFANDTVVRGNIVANNSATGVQLRVGGLVEGNLVLRNPLGITIGHEQTPQSMPLSAVVRDNVVLDSRDIADRPRGYGIAVGKGFGIVVQRNVVAHQMHGTSDIYAIRVDEPSSTSINVNVLDNVVYDWARGGRGAALSVGGAINGLHVQRNQFSQPVGGDVLDIAYPQTVQLWMNRFYSPGAVHWGTTFDALLVFRMGLGTMNAASFLAAMGDRTSVFEPISYPDPSRDVASYAASQGFEASYESFIREARKLSRIEHRSTFTAPVVNAYIRSGFGMTP